MHVYSRNWLVALAAAAALALSGCATVKGWGEKIGIGGGKLALSGSQEVPAVSTEASGTSTITVASDRSVAGSVTTKGMNGVAAHIHTGAAGKNGPVIVPLTKTADNVWSVPAGAKLTEAQYEAYKAGDLYVNVHSPSHKGGEIRAQLKP